MIIIATPEEMKEFLESQQHSHLRSNYDTYDLANDNPFKIDIPETCKKCSNHWSNGGSGVCCCALANHGLSN